MVGADTIEDDQSAKITVEGDHATVTFKPKEIQATSLIKVDGKWLIDMHAMFTQFLKQNPDLDTNNLQTAKLMKQTATDIKDGKFDDADSFFADFKAKYDALTGGN
jgi:hypothetical protein